MAETQHYLLDRVSEIEDAKVLKQYDRAANLLGELLVLLTEEGIKLETSRNYDLTHIKSVIAQTVGTKA